MNGKQLKNSILQWAIQGKLVPQDQNDEPASVLLERIREEKARLVKEEKIKKDKNESIIFRGDDNSYYEKFHATGEVKCIDEEIPFEIPKSWIWCRFSAIYRLLTDGVHNTPKYTEFGIPFISVKDMSSGKLSFSNTKYISEEEHRILSARCYPEKGDLLISKVGTTGIPLIIDTDKEFSIFVSLALIKFFPSYIDSKFLIYLIKSPLIQEQVKRDTRGVGNKNWVLTAIANTLLAIPPLAEQQRIVSKIEDIMPVAEKYDRSQDALDKLNAEIFDKLKKSVLQEAIQGKLVPQDPNDEPASVLLERIKDEKTKLFKEGKLKKKELVDSVIFKGEDNKYYERQGENIQCIEEDIPFHIPESWTWVRMGMLIKLIGGTSYQKGDIKSSGIRILRGGNIQDNQLVFCEDDVFVPYEYLDNEKNIQEGDTIIVASTGSPTVIGKPALISISIKDTQVGAFLRIIRPYSKNLSPYIQMIFTTEYYREHIRTKAKGTNINNIKSEYIEDMLVPIPPLAEQQRILFKSREIISSIMRR